MALREEFKTEFFRINFSHNVHSLKRSSQQTVILDSAAVEIWRVIFRQILAETAVKSC
jgi:hypothetical protein